MSDIFISYSGKDQEIANRIARDLQQSGYHVFYDKELVPGERWSSRLLQELHRAKYVLVLLSPAYVESDWGRRELEAAVLSESGGGPRIVPLLIQNTQVPAFLRDRHYADLRKDYESALAQVKKALAKQPEPTEELRAHWKSLQVGLLQIMLSLLASALAADVWGSFGVAGGVASLTPLAVIVALVVGLTALVAIISRYRPSRRAPLADIVAREVERRYIDALEESQLNPLRFREGAHG